MARPPVAVLAFAAGPTAGSDGEPIRELVGFHKIRIEVGASAEVEIALGAWELSSTDAGGQRRATAGRWAVAVGGAKAMLDVAK